MKRSGAYVLNITRKRITIEIADDRSLFYAAQTLKQLVGRNRRQAYPSVVHYHGLSGCALPWFCGRILRNSLESCRPYQPITFYGNLS